MPLTTPTLKFLLLLALITQGMQSSAQTTLAADSLSRMRANTAPVEIDFLEVLSPVFLQADLKILKQALEEAATGLYRYAPKEKTDSLFEQALSATAAGAMTYQDFVKQVAALFNTIACGHSGWSHNPVFTKYRDSTLKFFPLEIYALGDEYYVRSNGSADERIARFDQVLEINGQTPAELNKTLKGYMSRDGSSGHKGRSEIEKYFPMTYSNFIGTPDTFRLKMKSYGQGEVYHTNLPAACRQDIQAKISARNQHQKEETGMPLRFSADTATSSAVYTIKWSALCGAV